MASLQNANPYAGFRGVFMREWRRFASDNPMKILLLGIAPAVLWLFASFCGDGAVKNLPVAVYDADNSALTRAAIRMIDATRLMKVTAHVESIAELEKGIESGRFAGGFFLPPCMEADIKAGRQVQPVIFRNGTAFIASSFIAREGLGIFRTLSAGIVMSRLSKSGMSSEAALALVSPVGVDASNLYNTVMSYQNYLAPGIMFAQLGMIVMIAGAVCFAREKEHGTLLRFRRRARGNHLAALHGKTAPYALIIGLLVLLMLAILFPLKGIADFPDAAAALPAIFLFLAASWWMGALIGVITGQVMLGASISIFMGMPAFIFSGWTFPLPAAPGIMGAAAQILPFTHFMPGWFSAARMHMGPFSSPAALLILFAMTVAAHMFTHMLLVQQWKQPEAAAKNPDGSHA